MASSLFLGLFSLTFATLFRHPLAGFGVAALYWACDLPPGPPINSYLSLKSLTFSFPPAGVPLGQPLTDYWWIAKILLLVFAIALYLFHKRLLFTLGSPLTVRRRRRTLFWIGGILCFYLVTGAVSKVAYGYANRSKLFPNDITWFRRQFGPFGPVPVARLFGANFQRYLGGIPSSWRVQSEGDTADSFGDTIQHRQDLDRILQTAPNSIWAPSAAILAAHFGAHNEVPTDEKVKAYYYAADHYPDSPYTPYAMQQIAFLYANSITSDATCEQKAREAYANLIKHYPKGEYNSESYRFLAESARRHSDIAGAARYVQQWIEVAPVYDKFMALMLLADIRREEGKDGEAKKVAKQALQAIAEFNVALRAGPLPLSEQRRVRIEKDASDAEKRARAF